MIATVWSQILLKLPYRRAKSFLTAKVSDYLPVRGSFSVGMSAIFIDIFLLFIFVSNSGVYCLSHFKDSITDSTSLGPATFSSLLRIGDRSLSPYSCCFSCISLPLSFQNCISCRVRAVKRRRNWTEKGVYFRVLQPPVELRGLHLINIDRYILRL